MPEIDNKDLNNGGSDAGANGQAPQTGDGNGSSSAGDQNNGQGEETVTIKKSEWEKTIADRDNYREGLLRRKAEERELGAPAGGDNAGGTGDDKSGGANSAQIDPVKIAEQASAKTLETIGKANENKAKIAFLKKHGEYVSDVEWNRLMTGFTPRRGKTSIEDILEDLEDAVLSDKRATGKLDEYMNSVREQGRREGEMQAQLHSAGNAGGNGDSGSGNSSQKPPSQAEEMARKFGHDPKKVLESDPAKNNEIDLLAKR